MAQRAAASPPPTKKPGKKLNKIRGKTQSRATKPGRPSLYDPNNHDDRAKNLALLGLKDTEIADAFGISEVTLNGWKQRHPSFLKSINEGKIDADATISRRLYERAAGLVKMPAVKVFYDKDKGEPVYAPYVEHLAPDVNAQRLWLLNRQPGRWRERREIDMTVSLEMEIARLSPEERAARLLELQAKAGILIEGEASEVEGAG